MFLYTIVCDYKLGTYISQYTADSPESAVLQWTANFDFRVISGLNNHVRKSVVKSLGQDSLTKVTELNEVLCTCALVKEGLLLLHIIKTMQETSHR